MTKNEARTEIKYLLNNISLTDEAEAIDEIYLSRFRNSRRKLTTSAALKIRQRRQSAPPPAMSI